MKSPQFPQTFLQNLYIICLCKIENFYCDHRDFDTVFMKIQQMNIIILSKTLISGHYFGHYYFLMYASGGPPVTKYQAILIWW